MVYVQYVGVFGVLDGWCVCVGVVLGCDWFFEFWVDGCYVY